MYSHRATGSARKGLDILPHSFLCLVNWDIYTTLVVHVEGRTCLRAEYFTYIMSVLLEGRFFIAKAGTKVAILSKGRSSTANSETKVADLLDINRWGSFPLLSAPHSLFSIWTDIKRSEKIPGAPAWSWEWIWLTGPSELHRNSPQGLNIRSMRVFDQNRDPEIPITLRPLMWYHQSVLPKGRSFTAN